MAGNLVVTMFDNELLVVPSALGDVEPILGVAKEVESSNPRVAYRCRCYAYHIAQRLDPASSGRGVSQFLTAMLRSLQRENDPILIERWKNSDVHEIERIYQHYYNEYIQAFQNAADKADRSSAQITKLYQTAKILFEVLRYINWKETMEVDCQIVEPLFPERIQMCVPYNILPLDPDSANQAIMKYPEIQAAVVALRNTRGLRWPKKHNQKQDEDILDWLQEKYGFQKDNVANQREHLILLLANVHIRQFPKSDGQPELDDRALKDVMKKLFKN
ncbi:callose synthase 3-like [Pistacia vera]|uniref:callose synthase 3-like n=1 Tax=Pistacia vera TaxID=55513 RepID=UPI00126395B6|nr:callose synthase 3-like [Pistacia vera]